MIQDVAKPEPKYTQVRISKTTKKVAEKKAKKQNRSVANYVDKLILDDK